MIGRIYKLEGGGKFYIGSTTCELNYRLKKHKSKSNELISKNRLLYLHFKEIGWNNANMILILEVEVNLRNELLKYEKDEIMKVINDPNCLNSILPITTIEERKKRNLDYDRQRRQKNPEKQRARLQKWREANPEKYKEQYSRHNAKKRM